MKKFWDALLGILAPEKYLHNRSFRDAEEHEKTRQALNAELALKAMELAKHGMVVELKCTNSGWVEFRAVPTDGSPAFTYNGSAFDVQVPARRGH